MIALRSITLYLGSTPEGDILLRCRKGEALPAGWKEYREQLEAHGVIEQGGKVQEDGAGGKSKSKSTSKEKGNGTHKQR